MYQPDLSQATPTLNAVKVLLQDNLPPTPPTTTSGTGPDFTYANGLTASSWAIHGVDGVALDGQGNVFISTKGASENVYRFPAAIPTPQAGKGYSADVEIFKQAAFGVFNQIGWNGFNVVYGVAVGQDNPKPQLVVADSYRLDFWNLPAGGLQPGQAAITNGQPPDGYAGVNSTSVTLPGTGPTDVARSESYTFHRFGGGGLVGARASSKNPNLRLTGSALGGVVAMGNIYKQSVTGTAAT